MKDKKHKSILLKKNFLILSLFVAGGTVNAPFSIYHGSNEYEEARTAPVQTVYGYVPTHNGWVRISLHVKVINNSVMVLRYKEKNTSKYGSYFSTYGNSNSWRKCQFWAQEVSVYSEGREIANNFDYKASISGLGTVYF